MSSGARGSTRARPSLRVGIFGAEPWGEGMRAEIESAFDIDACDIYGLSEVMGPGVAQEFARTKDGPDDLGRSLHRRDRGSGERPGGRRRRAGRIGVHLADQGSHAGDPLPDARSDPAAAGIRDRDAAHGQDQRPHRRHADHSRRQCIPVANRRIDPALQGTGAALRDRDHAAASPRRNRHRRRSACGTRESRSSGRSRGCWPRS